MTKAKESENKVLDSWKEIANFLKRGVRTVQRWEETEGLPVRRQHHLKKGSVCALRSEIEQWQTTRVLRSDRGDGNLKPGGSLRLTAEHLDRLCVAARSHARAVRAFGDRQKVKTQVKHFVVPDSSAMLKTPALGGGRARKL